MSEDEESVVVCYRVSDGPPRTASKQSICMVCGEKLWVADSSPKHPTICFPCCRDKIEDQIANGEPVEFMPPTEVQLADMKRSRN